MRYFIIRSMGDANNRSLCFLTEPSEGLGAMSYKIGFGEKIGAEWSTKARLVMDPDFPGLKLSSILGNSCACIVAHRDVAAVMQEFVKDIELLSVTIVNHRKKAASSDYVIVNVLGTIDCLDEAASKVKRSPKGNFAGMGAPVIDARKIPKNCHLFRFSQSPADLIISFDLGKALAAKKFTNVVLDEVTVLNQ